MSRRLGIAVAAMIVGFGFSDARANIIQSQFNNTLDVNNTAAGQSFTADSSVVNLTSFAFVLSSNAAGVNASANLCAGQGYGGTLLDTASATVPIIAPFNSPVTFDFTGNTLTPGNVYSVRVISDAQLDLQFFSGSTDQYADGVLLGSTGVPIFSSNADFKFIVSGTVPEPASLGLIAIAGGILGVRRRRPGR